MKNMISDAHRAKQTFLKLKIRHLAVEPAMIRQEARKSYRGSFRWRYRAALKKLFTHDDIAAGRSKWDVLASPEGRARFKALKAHNPPVAFTEEPFLAVRLNDHRLGVVRPEARAAQLAYAFIRGKDYAATEVGAKSDPNWRRVGEIVIKYGNLPDGTTKDEATKILLAWRDKSLEDKVKAA